ncbi:hypothetical protein SISSUDRAFT_1038509 [Sistotremastrum suecicum HHB10207 ss-3]|uniref:Uncharacterized protein n=1 Tax=Sistotremastrum suecicum HHB10207 ss-3 TaxID=1314776 RepID=A0A165WMI9_9AGAM|nr:hypothetical protein SISSUDRAFT_1038509 [Sistotremastrum suecicum HHB10207 ss-3]
MSGPPNTPVASSEEYETGWPESTSVVPDAHVQLVLASLKQVDLRSQSLARNAENAAHELEQRISEVNDDTKQNHKQIILAEKRIVGTLSDLEQRINVTSAQADGFQTFQRETTHRKEVESMSSHLSKGLDSMGHTNANILGECQSVQKSLGKLISTLKVEFTSLKDLLQIHECAIPDTTISRLVNSIPMPVVDNTDALRELADLRAWFEEADRARIASLGSLELQLSNELFLRVPVADQVTLYDELQTENVSHASVPGWLVIPLIVRRIWLKWTTAAYLSPRLRSFKETRIVANGILPRSWLFSAFVVFIVSLWTTEILYPADKGWRPPHSPGQYTPIPHFFR